MSNAYNNNQSNNELYDSVFLDEPAYTVKIEGVQIVVSQSAFSMFKELPNKIILEKIDAMCRVFTFSLKTLRRQGRGLVIGFGKAYAGVLTSKPVLKTRLL